MIDSVTNNNSSGVTLQNAHRGDIAKPAATIAQYAPDRLHSRLTGELDAVGAAIETAIGTLDF